MPLLKITTPSGEEVRLQVASGVSAMRAAVDAGVEGIVGECGGAAMCGTCHVFVEPAWLAALPPLSQNEQDILDFVATPREANSRLACQLRMTDALDGLTLHLPASQR